jgi:REP element-mobilizing transposase RayT
MPRPIVIVHHLIWTAYGWWLPNDPRGSTSRTIANDVIAELGELHFGRRAIQPTYQAIHAFYDRAKDVLKYPLLEFGPQEVEAIARAFSLAIQQQRYTCYACAIMPDHVHLLIRKHKHQAEEMIIALQDAARSQLRATGLRDTDHPTWATGGWKGFLDHPEAVRRTIRYIEENPLKRRLPGQKWTFVKTYDGWPFHPGHSPNSPYVRRLHEGREG